MQCKFASVVVVLALFGVFPASTKSATESTSPGDVGTPQWFKAMRSADANSAMLKALPGSNGQAVVPPDCVEISAVLNLAAGRAKERLPHLRILSTDDRMDNVPRSPYIYQTPGQAPYFYTVLKRELTYEFYWLDGMREERIGTWRVPPGAGNQLRLVFAVDGRGAARIALAGAAGKREAAR